MVVFLIFSVFYNGFEAFSLQTCLWPPMATPAPRSLPNASQMPPRCFPDASQMPPRCLPHFYHGHINYQIMAYELPYYAILWNIMIYYDILWHMLWYYDILWHFMKYSYISQNMQPAQIALLDMFSHGKSKNSPLLNSFWCNIQKCLHYKVLCTTLGGSIIF